MDNMQKLLLTVLGTAGVLAAATTFLSNASLSTEEAEAPVIVENPAPHPVAATQPPSEPILDDVDYQYGKFGEPMMDPSPTLEFGRSIAPGEQKKEVASNNEGFLQQDDRKDYEDEDNIREY